MDKNTYQTESMIIRIEDLLNGVPFETLRQNVEEYAYNYRVALSKRIKDLNNHEFEESEIMAEKEIIKTLEKIKDLGNSLTDIPMKEKEEIYDLYRNIINNKYGPHEYEGNSIFFFEEFSKDDFLNDIDIFSEVLNFVIKNMKRPNYIYKLEKLKYYKNLRRKISESSKKLTLAIDRNILFKNFDKVIEILKNIDDYAIDLIIDYDGMKLDKNDWNERVPYSLNEEEMKKLIELKDINLRDDIKCSIDDIRFSDFYKINFLPTEIKKLWTINDVIKANKFIMDFKQMIEKENFSSFETIVFMAIYINKFNYYGNATYDEKTRTFITAEKSIKKDDLNITGNEKDAFVCTGYASYCKELIDKMQNKNIQAFLVPLSFYKSRTHTKKWTSNHMILLIKIKDDKYNIDGYYLWDPTWTVDNQFQYLLYPVEDVENFTRYEADIVNPHEISRIRKYIVTIRFNNHDKNVNNEFIKQYGGNRPIKVKQFHDALKAIYTKINRSKNFHFSDSKWSNGEEFANSIIDSVTLSPYDDFVKDKTHNDFYSIK